MENFNFKQLLKDKNKLLIIACLVIAIVFFIIIFGKNGNVQKISATSDSSQTILEPEAEGEEKISNKIEAYKLEEEEKKRKKRELEESQVRGSDFYFNMQNSDEEYNEKMVQRVQKLRRDPYVEVISEYQPKGQRNNNSSFSSRMRQQLNDIEDEQTLDQIIKDAKKDERMRKELEKNKAFRKKLYGKIANTHSEEDNLTMKSSSKTTDEVFPKVESNTPIEFEQEVKPESVFIVEDGKRKRKPQFNPEIKENLIKASIYGDQVIVSGSVVKMRLLEPLWVGGVEIPTNTIFSGTAVLGSSRLNVIVKNIKYGKFITPVTFTIYDSDAIEGLNLPNNMKADAARKMEQGLLQGVQLPISSIGTITSEVTSAITATTQVAKQILNQSLSQVKVHLKANYQLYIKEETKEDRLRREEEETEVKRLYKEMLLQQNNPVRKNPLQSFIKSLE